MHQSITTQSLPLLLLLSLTLLVALAPSAYAHPFIEDTVPSTAQNAQAGTDEVVVFFSEAVDIEFSDVTVMDDKGNRIDNRDLRYHQGDTSLAVSTPPMVDGVYTVSTKVLSKVDGHLVPGVFLFGVGDVVIDQELLDREMSTEILLLPEAGADLPGLIGQTVIVGAAVGALAVWGAHARMHAGPRGSGGGTEAEFAAEDRAHYGRFVQITGAGLLLVLASNILVITLQMSRLESGLVEAVQTQFGTIWLARMAITVALFGVWFAANRTRRQQKQSRRWPQAAMLAAALALMMTSSMSGHGAATETVEALALDYIHNIVAGVWIGGIIYIAFGILPALSGCPEPLRERISLASIPRFSAIFIISVGIVIVTGPVLLWTLESDVGMITESVFGRLIILKVAIASVMVATGGLVQYRIQRGAESDIRASRRPAVHGRLKKTLRVDAALGVSLLVVVALLTNGTLPAGEIRSVEAQEVFPGFTATEFADSVRFDVEITPFGTGDNVIVVSASDAGGGGIDDLGGIKAKVSNPGRGIPPIEIEMAEVPLPGSGDQAAGGSGTYRGDLTLAFAGAWLLEIEAQRTQSASESIRLDIDARPRLASLDFSITEYALPNGTSPLHAAFDPVTGSMWFTDASAPRLWEVDTETGGMAPHAFDGESSSFITYNERDGRMWFTDSRGGHIGYVDPQNPGNGITTIRTPDFESRAPTPDPATQDRAMPFFIEAGHDGDIWLTVINKGLIARYDPQSGRFAEIAVPGRDTFPFALAVGSDGMMWYTATGSGTVGYVDPSSNVLTEVLDGMVAPEALLFEDRRAGGGLWISEHTGLAIARYDTVLETVQRHAVPDPDALPFGMAFDRYGNIWFAEHTTDKIGVIDPRNGEIIEVDIPTQTSFVQFVEADGDGDIWFAEQRGEKIGVLSITERPSIGGSGAAQSDGGDGVQGPPAYDVRYADFVSPLVALGVLSASLFYVRAVHDRRRLDGVIMNMPPD